MLLQIVKYIFKLSGWVVKGQAPPRPHKFIVCFAPHTSDWDVIYTAGAAVTAKIDFKMLVNKKVMVHVVGAVMRSLGAIPVNKDENEGTVSKAVELFRTKEQFVLAVNPEGGKDKCTKFRTGFYHIAKQANVPILLCAIDYGIKTATIVELFHPTDDAEKDLARIWNVFADVPGKFPEKGISGTPTF